jgi:hypothetical protein
VTGSLPRSDATETDGAEASEATFRQLEPKP